MSTSIESVAATAFVGRQPIFATNLDVNGYELLFRSNEQNLATIFDGDHATANVVLNTLTDIGLDCVAGAKRAFVNLTRNLLLEADLHCLPAEHLVLEVLEDVVPDVEVVSAIERLSADGYCIALDDVVFRSELEPLIRLADIVKLEYPKIPRGELSDHIKRIRDLGVRTILAEKLETHEDFETCKDLGCDLFQGYFFQRPQVLSRRQLPSNVCNIVRLVSKLQSPNVSFAEIESLIQTDTNLSYKVLRYVNSISAACTHSVDSIGHAISLLGIRRLRSLASMMLLATADIGKPKELANTAMIRARMCQLLAQWAGEDQSDRHFTLGLLSTMDAMLDLPMCDVVKLLPLSKEMNRALLNHEGRLGQCLASVVRLEKGNESIEERPMLSTAYIAALEWADNLEDVGQA